MEKQRVIQLTNGLYRLAQLFPKKEPLRYKIRGVAIDILEKSLRVISEPETKQGDTEDDLRPEILNDIGIMQAFLTIAKEQNWVRAEEILSISKGYDILKQGLEESNKDNSDSNEGGQQTPVFQALTADQPVIDFESSHKNRQRQEKILEILKEKGKAQVWELKQILPGVSKRTLRRDFEYMLNQGLVERIGERNQTFYQVSGTVPDTVGQASLHTA